MAEVVVTRRGPVEVAVEGDGPAVVILHGTPGSSEQGRLFARLVAVEGLRFVSPARPGYGRTPLASGPAVEDQGDLVAAVLDALGIDRAAVVGISGGGPAALHFALEHPARCRSLVLLSAVTGSLAREIPPWLSTVMLGPVGTRVLPAIVRASLLLSRPLPDRARTLHELLLTILPGGNAGGVRNDHGRIASLADWDLSSIAVPTLVIHGTEDRLVPFAHARRAVASISGAEICALEGRGHYVVATRTKAIVERVASFLDATRGTAI